MTLRPLAAIVAASALLLSLLLAALAGAGPTLAHANLVSSVPGVGSVVATSPAQIRIVFSEPIEALGTSADVLDAVGHAVVAEAGAPDPADPYALVIPIPPLDDGAYTVQWRSLSAADGHVTQGFFTFAVGAGSVLPSPVPGTGGAGDIHAGHSAATAVLETIGRALSDLGTMLAFGLALVALVVVLPPAPGLAGPMAAAAAWAALLGSSGTALLAQTAAQSASLSLADYVTQTHNGTFVLARTLLLLAGGIAALLLGRRSPRWSLAVSATTGIVAVGLLADAGHAAGFDALAPVLAMVVHVAAAGVWLAGLITLAILGLASRGRPALPLGTPSLPSFVPRFSALALVAAALFGFTGLAFADQLAGGVVVLDSPYGVLVGAKIVLVLGALGLGALNFLAPRGEASPAGAMRWRIPLEAGVVGAVVVVSALLASGNPPGLERPVWLAPAGAIVRDDVALAIEPARPGPQRFVVELSPSLAGVTAVALDLQRIDIDQGSSRVPMSSDPTDTRRWISDGGLFPANSSWTATAVAFDSGGVQIARQRFDLVFDSERLSSGEATAAITIRLLCGIALLGLAVLALTMGLAGGALPRTPPRLGRFALIVGAAIAGPIGLLLVFVWPT
jgi:methionine-rich copper-binding protein CopC/putative copper export protein